MRGSLSLTRMIMREIQRAKANTILCLAVVVLATGLLVAMVSISQASVDSTRVMMKKMGFNLLITPPGVDPARYQALDFQSADMPEEYVHRLAESTALAQHFVGKYQKTIQVNGATVVLTGVLAEVPKIGDAKKPMPTAYVVPEGEVYLGSAVAEILDLAPGGRIEILGRDFKVGKVLDEAGIIPDDIRVYAHLHDVQELLGVPGRINAIDALACYCPVSVDDIFTALEKSVHAVLPDVGVQAYRSILQARQKQRDMMYRLELVALAIILACSATAIWGLTYQNVHNRRQEIGVFRALGVSDWRIAALFVGKIIGYSLIGAAAGCHLGYFVARWLSLTDLIVAYSPSLIMSVILATPITAVIFGLPPVVNGLLQEPSDVLREAAA